MQIKYRTNEIMVICGMIESGKSFFMKHIAKTIHRRIMWDYNREHADMGYVVHFDHQIKEHFLDEGLRHIVFQPYRRSMADFEAFLRAIQPFRNYTLIIEEVERYCTSSPKYMPQILKDHIDTGAHHRATGLIVTCRRIAEVHPSITFNANHVVMFKQFRHADRKRLNKDFGIDIEALKKLKDYYYWHFYRGKLHFKEPV